MAELKARDDRRAKLSPAEQFRHELSDALWLMLIGIGVLMTTIVLGLSGPSLDTLRYMPYLQLAGYGAIGLGLWITIAGLRKSGK